MNNLKSLFIFVFSYTATFVSVGQNAKQITHTYSDGEIKVEGEVVEGTFFEGAHLHGTHSDKVKDANSSQCLLKHGTWKIYNKDGSLIEEINYDKGVRVGIRKAYFSNGNVSEVIDYTTGKAVFYYDNGQKSQEGILNEKDLKNGYWKGWYSNGSLMYEGTFDNGAEVSVKHFSKK